MRATPGRASVAAVRARDLVRVRARAVVALALAVTSIPAAAGAVPRRPSAHLVVTRGGGGAGCPDADAFAAEVATRLGYDPRDPASTRRAEVRFDGEGGTIVATITVSVDGRPAGVRTLSGRGPSCRLVAERAALTVALVLDPDADGAPADADAPADVPTPSATPAATASARPAEVPAGSSGAAPASPASRGERVRVHALGGAAAVLGAAPAPAVGVRFGVGVTLGHARVDVEGLVDVPSSNGGEPLDGAPGSFSARTTRLGAAVAPCGVFTPVRVCAVVAAGSLRGEVPGASPRERSNAFVEAGPRLGLELPLAGRIALDMRADLPLQLARTELAAGDTVLFRQAIVTASFGAGLVGHFP